MALTAIPVGFFAGLLGIGGGLITVPVLYYIFGNFGLDNSFIMHLAVGTSFSIIIPTSISSTLTHMKYKAVYLDIVKLIEFEGLPSVFQRHIVARTARVAATQLVSNPQLVQLLAQNEQLTRASCVEYECNQGNHSMFGFPEDTVYTTYAPWRNLRR